MKNLFTFFIAFLILFPAAAQQRAVVSKSYRDIAVKKPAPPMEASQFVKADNQTVTTDVITMDEETIGQTRYDDQSNASIQNRMYLYDDGTIGATWIFGLDDPNFTNDRGAGYNYFDGSSWGPYPTVKVEEERCGWPSYSPLGENGEIIVSHTGDEGLQISSRSQKGTGTWEYSLLEGPSGNHILWNRSITSGDNFNRVHVLGLTLPVSYGGTVYAGLDGALVYSMSTDGGLNWDIDNIVLDGMTSNEYVAFSSDNYTWADPKGDILAFVVGESWYDMFIMKSNDGGQTFEKTLIWENPYPFFNPGTPTVTDTFYCADGAHSIVIDNNDMIHVAFGINRAYSDGSGTFWFPGVGGIGYWNENMSVFSNDMNALSPYGDPGSELIEDYNLIGWTQDINGNDTIDVLDEWGTYYLGFSSMPQLVYGENNQLFLIYSSVTETYDNDVLNYRHLWSRASPDGGTTWGYFLDLTSDLIHIFDECVYPSCAAKSDNNVHLTYQQDNEPGNATWGAQHPYNDNNIVYMKVTKADMLQTGINGNQAILRDIDVSQNFPNPFSTISKINVNLKNASDLHLSVINMLGQLVYESSAINAKAGMNTLTINGGDLTPGIYFYTIKAGDSTVSKKMIIE